jgi:WD40 repeat protein
MQVKYLWHADNSNNDSSDVRSVEFDPSGTKFVVGSNRNAPLYLYNLQDLNSRTSLVNSENFTNAIFSFDGSFIAACSGIELSSPPGRDNLIKLWDTNTRKIVKTIQRYQSIGSLTFGNKSFLLASGEDDGHVYIWDLKDFLSNKSKSFWNLFSGKPSPVHILQSFEAQANFKSNLIRCLAFDPQDEHLILINGIGEVRYGALNYTSTSTRIIYTFQHDAIFASATFLPDGESVLLSCGVADEETVVLLNLKNNTAVKLGSGIRAAVGYQGRIAVWVAKNVMDGNKPKIYIYDLENSRLLHVTDGNECPNSIALNSVSGLILCGGGVGGTTHNKDSLAIWSLQW